TAQQIEDLKKITSPSVANAIETFKIRPREVGNVSSEIRGLFPELGPLVGYAATCIIRAEPGPIEGHRTSTYGWWAYVVSIPAPHISVSHANVHMVDFGIPVKVGGVWIKPGDLVHLDQHGVVTIPEEIAPQIPAAIAKVEADEKKIISTCQASGFSVDKLKELYKQIRPGTY